MMTRCYRVRWTGGGPRSSIDEDPTDSDDHLGSDRSAALATFHFRTRRENRVGSAATGVN